ncbi:MAG: diaminopimelate epimerase, partial [Brevibacterium aurantiacum]
ACAAAIAAHHWAGPNSPLQWRVDVPGGQLRIGITPNEDGTRGSVTLSGPAVLVADGTIS